MNVGFCIRFDLHREEQSLGKVGIRVPFPVG
jgi:hypothetical protein